MNDKKFLALSLRQSFAQPKINGDYFNMFAKYHDSADFIYICNRKFHYLNPWIITPKFCRKCLHSMKHDSFHCDELFHALQTLKHNLSENIVMPEDFPEAETIAVTLQLKSLTRSSAQKKLTASFFQPLDFEKKLHNCYEQILRLSEQLSNIAQQDSASYLIALLKDFTTEYHQILHQPIGVNLFLHLNRKTLKQHLADTWIKIKNHQAPNISDLLNLPLKGQSFIFFKTYLYELRSLLLSLTTKLLSLADYPETYSLIDTFISNPKKYRRDFNEFCRQRLAPNSDDIYQLFRAAKALQNDYLMLCYLAGTINTFENKFLDQIPLERQPELPTVDPQKELKEIKKIVAKSQHNTLAKTRTSQFGTNLLHAFAKDLSRVNDLWQRYTGPSHQSFTKSSQFDTNILDKTKK